MLRRQGGELQVQQREVQGREVQQREVQGREVDQQIIEVQRREVEVQNVGFGEAEVHLKKLSDYKTLSKVGPFTNYPPFNNNLSPDPHLSPVTCNFPLT